MYAEFADRVRAFRRSVALYQAGVSARRMRALKPPESPPSQLATNRPLPDANTGSRGGLTPRQLEIARLIARGYTNQQVADALVLTPGTVANHVQHILARLGLHSRTQVAVWYSRRGGDLEPHHAARLELETGQTARRNQLARNPKVESIVQAIGDQPSQRLVTPGLSVD
jgi:DNA-binding CsgD family transcriptional regulator